jgi:hypothetical protein
MEEEKRRLRALIDEAINETQATLDELKGALAFFSADELDREWDVNELDEQAFDFAGDWNRGERVRVSSRSSLSSAETTRPSSPATPQSPLCLRLRRYAEVPSLDPLACLKPAILTWFCSGGNKSAGLRLSWSSEGR